VPIRTYTVEEANRKLPEVRDAVGRIVQMTEYLPELEDQLRIAEYKRRRPGASPAEAEEQREAARRLESAQLELAGAVHSLEELGVQLKDARSGLVDFFAYREGEVVELCWRLGEESVAHWHRIGEGFPGRKRLA
jgi:hypothetical protein